jgi:hypothetical protein
LLASGTRTVILTRDSDLEDNEDLNYGDKVSRFHNDILTCFQIENLKSLGHGSRISEENQIFWRGKLK